LAVSVLAKYFQMVQNFFGVGKGDPDTLSGHPLQVAPPWLDSTCLDLSDQAGRKIDGLGKLLLAELGHGAK
jgi:hypothetical protein